MTLPRARLSTVASPAKAYVSSATAWADDRYLYFGANGSQTGLLRVPVRGGAIETFWAAPRKIDAVTTVGCNVYWIADTDYPDLAPPELLVQPE